MKEVDWIELGTEIYFQIEYFSLSLKSFIIKCICATVNACNAGVEDDWVALCLQMYWGWPAGQSQGNIKKVEEISRKLKKYEGNQRNVRKVKEMWRKLRKYEESWRDIEY